MIVNVVVTKIIAAYILRQTQSQLRWMERDYGKAKQTNSYQKKYSNLNIYQVLTSSKSIDQYSQSIKHHSDFNWFRISEVYMFVEENVHGEKIHLNNETIPPKANKHSLQIPSFPALVSYPIQLLIMYFFYINQTCTNNFIY